MTWTTSTGEAVNATGDYEAPGGEMEPIPSNTTCLTFIDEASWHQNQAGLMYLNIRYRIMAPDAYKNRVVFQKLWVYDDDPNAKDPTKKKDKAIIMLANIDKNCGGGLQATGKKLTPLEDGISDEDLVRSLCNKPPMLITLQKWSMTGDNGDKIEGNWINKVQPGNAAGVTSTPVKAAKPAPAAATETLDGDDIPF